ncbi:hypothetical protein K2173_019412 [Erythroxylum novogranatense]|nr:hypothetical protein K2173_019412 [Erythroxylum novogranatense]
MALFTTFMTTPTVLVICKPLRRVASQARRLSHQQSVPESSQEEFQILACVHGPRSVPAIINLIESTRSITKPQLRLCVMHLVELTDRSSSIMMVQRARRNGVPFINGFSHCTSKDRIAAAFQTYAHVSRLTVHHSTAISALAIMHEDICQVAEDKKVEMIILPFHKQWMGEGDDAIENVGHGWRGVNQLVLETAPCTVAVLVDRGFGGSDIGGGATMTITRKRVCILFLGGADDRGALELGSVMAEHPTVSVTVMRFLVTDQSGTTVFSNSNSFSDTPEKNKSEKEMDEAALEDFKRKWNESVEYVEKEVRSITEEVITIGQSRGFELIVVGKGSCVADHQMEHSELGLIGDILASSEHCIIPSALVIRQGKFPEPTKPLSQNSLRARKPCALTPS